MTGSNFACAAVSLFALCLAPSCSSQKNVEEQSPFIRVVSLAEIEAEQEAENVRRERFQTALETAPKFSSEIRSSLIENPFSHRASYRSGSAEFQKLPHSFGCPHDPKIIANFQLNGWQIVKCELDQVTFFRRHGEAGDMSRRCFEGAGKKMKDLGDEFETLMISFPTFAASKVHAEFSMRDFLQRISFYVATEQVSAEALQNLGPLGRFKGGQFFHQDWSLFDSYYAVDETRKRLVQFDLRDSVDCKRNPKGWVKIGDQLLSLDSPQLSVEDMDKALSNAVALIGANTLESRTEKNNAQKN